MKIWQKFNNRDALGATVLEWRRRDLERFFGKIFSWLLGAFVFGILTSILFMAVDRADAAQPTARAVFFIVFAGGVTSSFFRCIVNGLSYQISEQAMMHVHPYFGWGKTDEPTAKAPFKPTFYAIPWTTVKEIREHKNGFSLLLQDQQEIHIPIHPVVRLSLNLNWSANDPRTKNTPKNNRPAYDKEVMRLVIKAAREAHKAAGR